MGQRVRCAPCRDVINNEIDNAVGCTDPDVKEPGQHLEKAIQQRIDQPEQRCGKDKQELKGLSDADQKRGDDQRNKGDFNFCLFSGLAVL